MALQLIWAFTIVSLVASAIADGCSAPTPTGTCSASVTIQPTQPGHGSFVYNNILVQNTGSCPLTKVFVDITLPPYQDAWAYYNVSDQTGELFGLPQPMISGSACGGTIVLQSMRSPMVSVGSVECDPTCSVPSPQSTRGIRTRTPIHPEEQPAKVEVQWGANPYWIAIHLAGDVDTTKEVRLTDAAGISNQLMKRETWDNKLAYTFSGVEMTLPLSLELKSIKDDTITLKNIITEFSHVVLDTGLSYKTNKDTQPQNEGEVKVQVHPDSNQNWVGIAPDSSRKVASVSLKGLNNDWSEMQQTRTGFFELASPSSEIQLPVSVRLAFEDSSSMVIENAVAEFAQQ